MNRKTLACMALAVGIAAGLSVPSLFAQEPSAQKWEQFCEQAPYKSARAEKTFERLRTYTNQRGAEGYELIGPPVMLHGYRAFCFRRPID